MKALVTVLILSCASLGCGTRELNGQSADGGGDAATTGEAVATACPGGSVTFQLNAAAGSSGFFVLQASPACWTANWLKIFDASGAERTLIHPVTGADCDTCAGRAYSDVCGTTSAMATQHFASIWNGQYFANNTCGTAGMACVALACAPAGHYKVSMCASDDAQMSTARRCVDVPFDYPAAGPVTGTFPAIAHN